ncbi:hypothetical protein C8R45DRAFT_936610 [Mycena sanguinolenta]|nr:hypothetical protein C8R45DRAFT_936610 [Mycena sanguinolenta]
MDSVPAFNTMSTIGALQIGTRAIRVTTTQIYTYYCHIPDDSLILKALVAFVCMHRKPHISVHDSRFWATRKDFWSSLCVSGIFSGFVTTCGAASGEVDYWFLPVK